MIPELQRALAALWGDYPMDMTAVSLGPPEGLFSLRGTCPHCRDVAGFLLVPNAMGMASNSVHFVAASILGQEAWAIMRCQSCLKLILGCAYRANNAAWIYKIHYPVGEPDDSVAAEVPEEIASDFREALRCDWIKAYRAVVLMCRRSLQVSCDKEKAKGNDLFKQIDDLASNQRITAPLKEMAHRIRLLGKRGAHGDYSDIDSTIDKSDAIDAITFMRHYLEHVYILPAKLNPPEKIVS